MNLLDTEIQATIDKLKSLPDEIMELRNQVNNFSEIDIISQNMALLEAETSFVVKNELDLNGKPAYTNESSRSNRVLQVLADNPAHKIFKEQLSKLKSDKQRKEAEVEKLINEFKAHRSLARLFSSILEQD